MWKRIAPIVAVALLATGCLVKDSYHTLYLNPDGSLTWDVLEREIRSDHRDPAERAGEEREFLERVRRQDHLAARSLDTLWPREVESHLLRGQRPYAVHTAAEFRDVERLFRNVLDELDVRGKVTVERDAMQTRFVIAFRPEDLEIEDEEEPQTLMLALTEADEFRIRLTEGKFLDAAGFELSEDDTLAVPLKPDDPEVEKRDGMAVYSLTWGSG